MLMQVTDKPSSSSKNGSYNLFAAGKNILKAKTRRGKFKFFRHNASVDRFYIQSRISFYILIF